MTNVTCGWCLKDFEVKITLTASGRGQLLCPHCRRFVVSSHKEKIGGRHIHRELKAGDFV